MQLENKLTLKEIIELGNKVLNNVEKWRDHVNKYYKKNLEYQAVGGDYMVCAGKLKSLSFTSPVEIFVLRFPFQGAIIDKEKGRGIQVGCYKGKDKEAFDFYYSFVDAYNKWAEETLKEIAERKVADANDALAKTREFLSKQ